MSVLIASGLRKEINGDPLFDGVSFTVRRRDRVALAGQNGAGKSTLLRAIAGQTAIDGGELALQRGTRIALHDQRPPRAPGVTLGSYALSGATDLVAIEEELRQLEQAMASGDHQPATLRRYSAAQDRLEHAGGWSWRERAVAVMRGLGFRDTDLDRPLDTFSGGELTRASLGRALAGQPDLLLLDEPTNHLDVSSLEWLEQELSSLDAAVVLVAHDRWFLESVTTAVLELEGGRGRFFPGPWHAWRRERAARASAAAKTVDRVDEDIARLERFVERFGAKKTKARQAQAKRTQIARLKQQRSRANADLEAVTARKRRLGFEFLAPPRTGRIVLEAASLSISVGDRVLLERAELVVERGEHVTIVGPNGSGKTTLLETLLALRLPAAGSVRLGHGVHAAYFSQHDAELDERGSVLDCAVSMTGLSRQNAQALLGRFLFSGWAEHEKQVRILSGGERRRLALACVVASGANLLVLDEPTNHLDLESREALESALEAFPGTLLLVSHDRALLDAVAGRTIAVEDHALRSYDGGWADLVATRDAEAALRSAPSATEPAAIRTAPKRTAGNRPKPPARSTLAQLEDRIDELEKVIAEVESQLADDWHNAELLETHRSARADLERLLARWESAAEESERTVRDAEG